MLSGYWLLSDLDGTLISTPHKAHGNYLSLTKSPCYAPLIRWLRNGGNLCVVTTADQRVLNQVYVPLQSTLREIESCYGVMSEACVAPQGTRVLQANEPPSGTLLLCLYTGAVLYHCTSSRVEMISSYSRSVHCATMEAVLLSRKYNVPMVSARVLVATVQNEQHSDGNTRHISDYLPRTTSKKLQPNSSLSDKAVNHDSNDSKLSFQNAKNAQMKYEEVESETRVCVRGTCMSLKTAEFIVEMIINLYERYLFDLLNGDATVQKRVGQLSRRYREMWRHIFEFLDLLYKSYIATSSVNNNNNNDTEKNSGSIGQTSAAISNDANRSWEVGSLEHSLNWKREYIHKHRDLFVVLGIVRLEFVSSTVYFDNNNNNNNSINTPAQATTTSITPSSSSSSSSTASSSLTTNSSETDKTTVTHTNATQHSNMLNAEQNNREQVKQALNDQAFVKQCGVKVLTEHLDEACTEKARPVIEAFASTMTQILGVEASSIRSAVKSRYELTTITTNNKSSNSKSNINSEMKSNQTASDSTNNIINVDSTVKQNTLMSKEHNDLSKSLECIHRNNNDGHNNANEDEVQVAQVILLGMPIALFTRYFTSTTVLPEFIRAGVQALPQPNSVVFCKLGISKSTALRYLLGNERVLACGGEPVEQTKHENIHLMNSTNDKWSKSHSLAGAVHNGCSVALGDNPHTTDYELTVFPSIPFISVEKDSQRSRRHARIARSMNESKKHNDNKSGNISTEGTNEKNNLINLLRKKVNFVKGVGGADATENKNGTSQTMNNNNNNENNDNNSCNVTSVSTDVLSAQRSSGSLMNDKLLSHLLYVGGEEEGTANFLTTLMNLLHVPQQSAHATAQASISIKEFKSAVKDAHKIARKKVVSSTLSKL